MEIRKLALALEMMRIKLIKINICRFYWERKCFEKMKTFPLSLSHLNETKL